MSKKLIALVVIASVGLSGCATSGAVGSPKLNPGADRSAMTSYLQQIPAGARIRVGLANGQSIKGTMMAVDERELTVQPSGRVPEPPMRLPIDDVLLVELQQPSSGLGKVIAVGAAAGAAATLGVMLMLWALLGGD